MEDVTKVVFILSAAAATDVLERLTGMFQPASTGRCSLNTKQTQQGEECTHLLTHRPPQTTHSHRYTAATPAAAAETGQHHSSNHGNGGQNSCNLKHAAAHQQFVPSIKPSYLFSSSVGLFHRWLNTETLWEMFSYLSSRACFPSLCPWKWMGIQAKTE